MSYRNSVEDELALRDLCSRYIDAVNRLDGDAWADTWAEDSCWYIMGQEISGRDNIYPFWRDTMGLFNFVIMAPNSSTFEILGNQATGRCYMTEYLSMKGTDPNMTQGVYDDSYVKEDGIWRFKTRNYQVLYSGPADLSGTYEPYKAP